MLLGDWNMVKLHHGSVGPTTHLHGTEEHRWKNLVDHLDLTDLYLAVVQQKGPMFTRQAICRARLDQARLDRVYSSNWGSWFSQVCLIEHDSK